MELCKGMHGKRKETQDAGNVQVNAGGNAREGSAYVED